MKNKLPIFYENIDSGQWITDITYNKLPNEYRKYYEMVEDIYDDCWDLNFYYNLYRFDENTVWFVKLDYPKAGITYDEFLLLPPEEQITYRPATKEETIIVKRNTPISPFGR